MNDQLHRREFLLGSLATVAAMATMTVACGATESTGTSLKNGGRWRMPAEEHAHAATWMCWPSTADVWDNALPTVQNTIAELARTIARYEPVKMLAQPTEVTRLRTRLPGTVEVIEAPVDDLWARDTLPLFLIATNLKDSVPLSAGRVRFNGWGKKQVYSGDTQLAGIVAAHLGIPLLDSGLTGEGGGVEADGNGILLAARSSWVNTNRNPGIAEDEISRRLVDLLGADRLIWVDGVAGEDITDSHIDTLARFAGSGVIIVDQPAYTAPGEVWYDVAVATRQTLAAVGQDRGGPFKLQPLVQPAKLHGKGKEFLASYVNYYVCNGAVIAPAFGEPAADQAAADVLRDRYPRREIVQFNIDPVAAGGGGIHCATQQQPAITSS